MRFPQPHMEDDENVGRSPPPPSTPSSAMLLDFPATAPSSSPVRRSSSDFPSFSSVTMTTISGRNHSDIIFRLDEENGNWEKEEGGGGGSDENVFTTADGPPQSTPSAVSLELREATAPAYSSPPSWRRNHSSAVSFWESSRSFSSVTTTITSGRNNNNQSYYDDTFFQRDDDDEGNSRRRSDPITRIRQSHSPQSTQSPPSAAVSVDDPLEAVVTTLSSSHGWRVSDVDDDPPEAAVTTSSRLVGRNNHSESLVGNNESFSSVTSGYNSDDVFRDEEDISRRELLAKKSALMKRRWATALISL